MSSSARTFEAPQDWQDLLKDEYKGLIWLSNYNTAGTAKLVINTMIQKYGHDEGIQYLVDPRQEHSGLHQVRLRPVKERRHR